MANKSLIDKEIELAKINAGIKEMEHAEKMREFQIREMEAENERMRLSLEKEKLKSGETGFIGGHKVIFKNGSIEPVQPDKKDETVDSSPKEEDDNKDENVDSSSKEEEEETPTEKELVNNAPPPPEPKKRGRPKKNSTQ